MQHEPVISFREDPKTHNMHICSDGEFYYTCNGGKSGEGQICKFSLKGNLVQCFAMELDMRSIMYNPSDKSFYVCCYDRNIYRITSLEGGEFTVVHRERYKDGQATLALSPDGKSFYVLDENTVKVYDMADGHLINSFSDISSGSDYATGACAVAVNKSGMYTWDGEKQIIYGYSKKGKFKKSWKVTKGSYGFSLSFANGLLFVSEDGDYNMGDWFGYKLK
jgi:WD40 repeat protein